MGKGSRYAGVERYEGKEGTRWIGRASKRLADGRRVHWEESHATEAGAYRARRDWLGAQEAGKAVERSKDTVADVLLRWLGNVVIHKARSTQRLYGDIVRVHLLPSPVAAIAVQRLTRATVQAWYDSLGHLSTRQRTFIHSRLLQALDYAVAGGLLPENPARGCSVPTYRPVRGAAFTDEQIAAFLAHADRDHYRPFWHVAVATGMRRGELLGLRWCDVDFRTRTLTIRQTHTWVRSPETQGRAKTESSLRAVRVGEGVLDLLRAHMARQSRWRERAGDRWEGTGAIFSTRRGTYLSPPDVVRAKKRLLALADLPPGLRIHDLRHTAISKQINAGVPVASVAAQGGYKNAATLLAVYTHPDEAGRQMAAEVLDDLLIRRGGGEMAGILPDHAIQS